MNRLDLVARVRSLTRDLSNAIFREVDVVAYVNEGIERMRQVIPEFASMASLDESSSVPTLLPTQYHHLLSVYSASRCFAQDERHYQASTLMNEFETKLNGLNSDIQGGRIVIVDPATGAPIKPAYVADHVVDVYYAKRHGVNDFDDGVNGVN